MTTGTEYLEERRGLGLQSNSSMRRLPVLDGPCSKIMRKVCLGLLLLLVPSLLATAQTTQDNLHWELVRPFRFFTDERLFDNLRNVYNGLDKKNAFELENSLQTRANADVQTIRDEAKAA